MLVQWLVMAAWAAPVDDARAWLDTGGPEAAIAVLDPVLATDPAAALLRFEIAAELGDDRSLAPVLTQATIEALPWSTRDRAHLVLGRAAAESGQAEAAVGLLKRVYPDAGLAYAEAQLILGDLHLEAGNAATAAQAWRSAIAAGARSEGLLRLTSLYEEMGRPATVLSYVTLIGPRDHGWGHSRIPLARAQLALGNEGEALGALVALQQPSIEAVQWEPEADFLRAEAWQMRCKGGRGVRIAATARAELHPVLAEIDGVLAAGPAPTEVWEAHFGYGAKGTLPRRWYRAFLERPDVGPGVHRLARIDRELVRVAVAGEDVLVAALAARRSATVEDLGVRLLAAMDAERRRLSELIEGGPAGEGLASEDAPRCELRPAGSRWPFRGEFWLDEIEGLFETPRCE